MVRRRGCASHHHVSHQTLPGERRSSWAVSMVLLAGSSSPFLRTQRRAQVLKSPFFVPPLLPMDVSSLLAQEVQRTHRGQRAWRAEQHCAPGCHAALVPRALPERDNAIVTLVGSPLWRMPHDSCQRGRPHAPALVQSWVSVSKACDL